MSGLGALFNSGNISIYIFLQETLEPFWRLIWSPWWVQTEFTSLISGLYINFSRNICLRKEFILTCMCLWVGSPIFVTNCRYVCWSMKCISSKRKAANTGQSQESSDEERACSNEVFRNCQSKVFLDNSLPPASEGWGEVMFSVYWPRRGYCPGVLPWPRLGHPPRTGYPPPPARTGVPWDRLRCGQYSSCGFLYQIWVETARKISSFNQLHTNQCGSRIFQKEAPTSKGAPTHNFTNFPRSVTANPLSQCISTELKWSLLVRAEYFFLSCSRLHSTRLILLLIQRTLIAVIQSTKPVPT